MLQGSKEFIKFSIIFIFLILGAVATGSTRIIIFTVMSLYIGIPIFTGFSSSSPRVKLFDLSIENDTNNNAYNTYRILCLMLYIIAALWIIILLACNIQTGTRRIEKKFIVPGIIASPFIVFLLSIVFPHLLHLFPTFF